MTGRRRRGAGGSVAVLLLAVLAVGCAPRSAPDAQSPATTSSFTPPTTPPYAAPRGAVPSGSVTSPGLAGTYAVPFPAVYTVLYAETGGPVGSGATSSVSYGFGRVRRWDPTDASVGDLRRCDITPGSALVPLAIEQHATGGPPQHVLSRLAEPLGDAQVLDPDQQPGWAAFFGGDQGARCDTWGDGVPGDDGGSALTTGSQQLLSDGAASSLVGYLVIPYYVDAAHPRGRTALLAQLSAAATSWTDESGVTVTVTGCSGPGATFRPQGVGDLPDCLLPFGAAVR